MTSSGRSSRKSRITVEPATVGLLIAGVLVAAFAFYAVTRNPEPPARAVDSTAAPAIAAEPSGQLATVFMGDSITQMSTPSFDTASAEDSWVSYVVTSPQSPWLQEANVAIAGQRTDQMLARFQDDVLARKPQAVVLLAGANDAVGGMPTEDSINNLRTMIGQARAIGAKVWMISPPPNKQPEDVEPLVNAERDLATELDVPFVDTFHALSADGTWSQTYSVDGVHPTVAGAQAIAKTVLEGFGTTAAS